MAITAACLLWLKFFQCLAPGVNNDLLNIFSFFYIMLIEICNIYKKIALRKGEAIMSYKKLKIFLQVLKNTFLWNAIIGYFIFFLISAGIILFAEPTVTKYGDALWYCFVSCTTIGFGDFAAAVLVGRVVTVILYIYTILVLALITAVFTQFFFEIAKARRNESTALLQYELEHLSELPKERLDEISEKIRKLLR